MVNKQIELQTQTFKPSNLSTQRVEHEKHYKFKLNTSCVSIT
jgi:hypothetical protein